MLLTASYSIAWGQKNVTVKINPYLSPNPPFKTGYNLLIADEFEGSFDAATWNKSKVGDDSPPYSNPGLCDSSQNTPYNQTNVLGNYGGSTHLRVRMGEDNNACLYSGGEIKSFSLDSLSSLRWWRIYPGSYLEIRAKMPACKGAGSSCWLYGLGDHSGIREIDIWEQYAGDHDQFQTNYHWGTCYHCKDHSDKNQRTYVQDLNGHHLYLPDYFLTFGVAWEDQKITWYLNDIKVREMNIGKFQEHFPYYVRIGSAAGLNANGYGECLPTDFQVDYIRIYKKAGTTAVSFKDVPKQLCSNFPWGDGDNISVTYYPGATYSWDTHSPYVVLNRNTNGLNQCSCDRYWLTVQPGTPSGIYPITVTVTFPSGYSEVLTQNIEVVNEAVPPVPTNIWVYQEYANPNVFYLKTSVAPGTIGYEWSIDGGPWVYSPNVPNALSNAYPYFFVAGTDSILLHACVRAVSACGKSSVYCRDQIIPARTADPWITLSPPGHIDVVLHETTQTYELSVMKDANAMGYEWSYDSLTWCRVPCEIGAQTNNFGAYSPGIPAFRIFIRAYNLLQKSQTYDQWITIPAENTEGEKPEGPTNFAATSQSLESDTDAESMRDIVYLYDLMGRPVLIRQWVNRHQWSDITAKLPSGIYVVIRQAQSGKVTSEKLFICNPTH